MVFPIHQDTDMIYVGIDIAKFNHFASAISSDGEVLIEPFKFMNDNDGFFALLSKFNSFDKNSVIIGLEPSVYQSGHFQAKHTQYQYCHRHLHTPPWKQALLMWKAPRSL